MKWLDFTSKHIPSLIRAALKGGAAFSTAAADGEVDEHEQAAIGALVLNELALETGWSVEIKPPVRWSHEPPEHSGWYWIDVGMIHAGHPSAVEVEVDEHGRIAVRAAGTSTVFDADMLAGARWAGPLSVPRDFVAPNPDDLPL
ncbi:MAG TPA: hypothetical protein DIC36_00970 [Gammaproteobacteria bacterium]|nr:hypothetical protein [Gammaproteobacteria bacterium]